MFARRQLQRFATPCLAILAAVVAIDPAHAVSVTAIPVAQGQLTSGVTSTGSPISDLVVVPVGGSSSGEVFGAGLLTRTSSNVTAFEFSLAPLNSLEPMRGYTVTSAILTVNYAGGSNFGPGGAPGNPSMLLSGYRDADGILTLGDFSRPALFSATKSGLPSVPPPDFMLLQSFDATAFIQSLYNQQSPFAGFRFDAIGSVNINGFNFSDASRRPALSIVAVIPEPETYALMAAGLGVLGLFAKGRRRTDRATSMRGSDEEQRVR